VTSSVTIYSDKSWGVFFHGRKVPTGNLLLSGFPNPFLSSVAT
jgi:hypothetical protein